MNCSFSEGRVFGNFGINDIAYAGNCVKVLKPAEGRAVKFGKARCDQLRSGGDKAGRVGEGAGWGEGAGEIEDGVDTLDLDGKVEPGRETPENLEAAEDLEGERFVETLEVGMVGKAGDISFLSLEEQSDHLIMMTRIRNK